MLLENRERKMFNSFCEGSIIVAPKPDKGATGKEGHPPRSPKNVDAGIFNKMSAVNPAIFRGTHRDHVGFLP